MVTPQPRKQKSRSLSTVVAGASIAIVCILAILAIVWIQQEDDPLGQQLPAQSTTTAPSSPPAKSPNPTPRLDTGAFQSCMGPIQEDRFFFPLLHDHSVVVSCHNLHYKLPLSLNRNRYFVVSEETLKVKRLVIGILSSAGAVERRDAIRQTWGENVFNRYFVVGGTDFEVVEKEFRKHEDMIWVDVEETYEDVLYKSGAMLAIFQRHINGFEHVLKTDDDSYINIPVLHEELLEGGEGYQQEYFGHCHVNRTIPYRPFQLSRLPPYFKKFIVNKTVYPEKWNAPYCQGAGYILGPLLLQCIGREIAKIRYHPFEDVAIGLVAERCGITAVRHSSEMEYKWHFQVGEVNLTGKLLQHPVESGADMMTRHKTVVQRGK
jgi:hypothetical protein